MKIAVIDHVGNPGGGSRVARALLPAMKKLRPDLKITFFGNRHGIIREKLHEVAQIHDFEIQNLSSVSLSGKDLFAIRGSRHLVTLLQRKLRNLLTFFPYFISGAVHRELEAKIRGFDIAFFTWPFHLRCPALECPMVGIFHDFNFHYYFTGHPLLPWVTQFLKEETPHWLSKATPIVSTEFMRTELQKFYPQFADKTKVVPIAPMSNVINLSKEEALQNIKKFKIHQKYLLCPTNLSSHKNVGPLIGAVPLLKKMGHDIGLVFTGPGTEVINGRACTIGIEKDVDPQDVWGLGYVSNLEVDSLIQSAAVVVNPSLYEGGNGAGFDAWEKGTPVAMSNIPPFLEHLKDHDVRAEIFDPRSPQDIAEKIDRILSNPVKTARDVEHSKQAIQRFTWETTAECYLKIFEEQLTTRALLRCS